MQALELTCRWYPAPPAIQREHHDVRIARGKVSVFGRTHATVDVAGAVDRAQRSPEQRSEFDRIEISARVASPLQPETGPPRAALGVGLLTDARCGPPSDKATWVELDTVDRKVRGGWPCIAGVVLMLGFIGLGSTGSRMARRLAEAGHPVGV